MTGMAKGGRSVLQSIQDFNIFFCLALNAKVHKNVLSMDLRKLEPLPKLRQHRRNGIDIVSRHQPPTPI